MDLLHLPYLHLSVRKCENRYGEGLHLSTLGTFYKPVSISSNSSWEEINTPQVKGKFIS
jgi:hypothetical protein